MSVVNRKWLLFALSSPSLHKVAGAAAESCVCACVCVELEGLSVQTAEEGGC